MLGCRNVRKKFWIFSGLRLLWVRVQVFTSVAKRDFSYRVPRLRTIWYGGVC